MTKQEIEFALDISTPIGYAEKRLGIKLHPVQADVLTALFEKNKTKITFRCANEVGKALWIGTPILTVSDGWKTMDDLKVGDKVFGSNGKPCSITFVTNTMYDRNCNNVEFSDGASIVADDEHLWKTTVTIPQYNNHALKEKKPRLSFKREEKISTTKQIKETLKWSHGKLSANAHQILLTKPLQYEEKELLIPPYILGLWLGDGNRSNVRLTSIDEEIITKWTNYGAENGLNIRKYKITYCLSAGRRKGSGLHTNKILTLFKNYNLINNKHIPEAYMRSSINQRMELLRGLMDTDGWVDKTKSRCWFANTNKKLAFQFHELVLGLGFKAKIIKKAAKLYGRFISWNWVIDFSAHGRPDVFSLKRKKDRILNDKIISNQRSLGRYITNISPTLSYPVKCIQVDSDDRCYLAGKELIVTHNSSIVGVTAILYSIEILGCIVLSTAAVYRQISKQLMPYLKQYAGKYHNWQFLDNQIKVNGETVYLGYASNSDFRSQGFHSFADKQLLFIVDEAAGVDDEIFQSIYRMNPAHLIIMGSPGGPEGFFYSVCTEPTMRKEYKHFTLNKLQCLKDDGWWLDKEDIESVIRTFGVENPFVRSTIYGEFATNIEGGIITLAEIEACLRTPAIPDYTGDKHVAIDTAAGGDQNVICFRNGNEVKIIKAWRDKDTHAAIRIIANELESLKRQYGISASNVSIDADGLGIVFANELKYLGWNCNEFHGNATAKDTACRNLITDCWINACKKIRNRSIIIPDNQELKLQLTSRKSWMNQSGKLELESKADMKSRGIPSPDIADAFAMSLSSPNSGAISFIQLALPKPKQYSLF